jgi:hypothetical protein
MTKKIFPMEPLIILAMSIFESAKKINEIKFEISTAANPDVTIRII